LYLRALVAHHVSNPSEPRREVPPMITMLCTPTTVDGGADFEPAGGSCGAVS
jgi:hypothetical protein